MGVRGVSVDTAVGVCKFPGEPADEIDPPGTCGPFVNCQLQLAVAEAAADCIGI